MHVAMVIISNNLVPSLQPAKKKALEWRLGMRLVVIDWSGDWE